VLASGIANHQAIYAKEDFLSIQDAINKANDGDTIYVPAGTYYEHVVINKTVTLVGAGSNTTVIDGGNNGTVVQIIVNGVTIRGFKLQNSGWGWYRSGVETQSANNCKIENNTLFQTCHNIRLNNSRNCLVYGNIIDHVSQMGYGIRLTESVDCTVSQNFVAQNIGGIVFENSSNCVAVNNYVTRNSDGIRLYSSCVGNRITDNIVFNNSYCGMIYPIPVDAFPQGNLIMHNNFINNTSPFIIQSSGNIWDDGHEGNYWTDYNGTDSDKNGIGDTAYNVGSDRDNYPLMGHISEFNIQQEERTYGLHIISPSEITSFRFESTNNSSRISFGIVEETKASGFCRITIPEQVGSSPFIVQVDENEAYNDSLRILNEASNSSVSTLYFAYPEGPHRITIICGLPNSSIAMIFQILLISFAVAIVVTLVSLRKLKIRQKRNRRFSNHRLEHCFNKL
jgi:parallel beta-helix repeat protein